VKLFEIPSLRVGLRRELVSLSVLRDGFLSSDTTSLKCFLLVCINGNSYDSFAINCHP
jgi:hypothetical protein